MLTLQPASRGLRGEMGVPGDKSISHRAVMLGAIAGGTTHVTGFLNGADCLSTIDCMRRLGVNITLSADETEVTVEGAGLHGLKPENDTAELYTGNSGTTTRILSGILAAQPFASRISGDDSINRRPMKRIMEPLGKMGADIVSEKGDGCAPLFIRPVSGLHGGAIKIATASAQVKSALLLAGLYADKPVTVIEPGPSRDHTERMLKAFGSGTITIHQPDGYHVGVFPTDELHAADISVPGDISSAAYFLVAASVIPGSELLIRNVGINPTRSGILEVLRLMGANITEENRRTEGGEPVADLYVRSAALHGTAVSGEIIPTLIDEIPVIAVAASLAHGVTFIKDAAELKVKESDRIKVMSEGLNAMGADVAPTPDGFVINGVDHLHGAAVKTYADHRAAMSFAVAALAADGETTLNDADCVKISYPGFFDDLNGLTA